MLPVRHVIHAGLPAETRIGIDQRKRLPDIFRLLADQHLHLVKKRIRPAEIDQALDLYKALLDGLEIGNN